VRKKGVRQKIESLYLFECTNMRIVATLKKSLFSTKTDVYFVWALPKTETIIFGRNHNKNVLFFVVCRCMKNIFFVWGPYYYTMRDLSFLCVSFISNGAVNALLVFFVLCVRGSPIEWCVCVCAYPVFFGKKTVANKKWKILWNFLYEGRTTTMWDLSFLLIVFFLRILFTILLILFKVLLII